MRVYLYHVVTRVRYRAWSTIISFGELRDKNENKYINQPKRNARVLRRYGRSPNYRAIMVIVAYCGCRARDVVAAVRRGRKSTGAAAIDKPRACYHRSAVAVAAFVVTRARKKPPAIAGWRRHALAVFVHVVHDRRRICMSVTRSRIIGPGSRFFHGSSKNSLFSYSKPCFFKFFYSNIKRNKN